MTHSNWLQRPGQGHLLLVCVILVSAVDAYHLQPSFQLRGKAPNAVDSRSIASSLSRRRPASLRMQANTEVSPDLKYLVVQNRVPVNPRTTPCACGSGFMYERCCGRWHSSENPPLDPVELIRARYSAFAYCLPDFLMRTTARKSPEYNTNQAMWRRELIDFCQSYSFQTNGGEILGVNVEECQFTEKDRAYVQFRARMLGPGSKLVEFWERSVLERSNAKGRQGCWYYLKGSLLEYQGPLI
ncbi:hypothetical protein GUITHDRAFT_160832 [Guillardia theta CCMP2712]|uniref:YchJ-like middle NTF2-like domain-containing protein n=2 Tax=Guillardia theta TaxID=55529 RepID=L1K0Q6_GUITC|nr:hypothetical protein GUITHDRAFT_160832 [Guillardia theta CCMP2712]EKX54192.1 hypothetical protein GUITHDRAFT_160832 [Guillardia theta CCMP2712]|eukprot:XP_005841172.1 hypothetical protein GUITHDRAFT_160832 [Guillardia theta CCMP2712]